jgi:hypothetical protein
MPLVFEFAKLMMGLAIMLFHRRIADYIMERERDLVVLVRQRGLPFPPAPTTETARNIYFGLGVFVALYEIARIWLITRGASL